VFDLNDSEDLLIVQEELPEGHRSGFVALVGKPNVGKSTLLNAWIGYKLAAVTPKPQTTRTSLLGILTRDDAQVIFCDTPGIHEPVTKLGAFMVDRAKRAVDDADLVLFIVDVSQPPDDEDRRVAHFLADALPATTPVILGLNKADLAQQPEEPEHRDAYASLGRFASVRAYSALTGMGRDALLEEIILALPEGPRFFPADQLTDANERFVAAETIREKALFFLHQEVPHALAVVVQEYSERDDGFLEIAATLYTERESQKGIVIGRGGTMLKKIGRAAREDLEAFTGSKVYLRLWVKVRPNWRKKEPLLRELGYPLPRHG